MRLELMGKCHCVNALIYLKVVKDERVQNMKGVYMNPSGQGKPSVRLAALDFNYLCSLIDK